jgi:hypothetical protein
MLENNLLGVTHFLCDKSLIAIALTSSFKTRGVTIKSLPYNEII